MLRGDWFKRYSIILIGIVLAALLIIGAAYVIKWGLERQIEYERYADEHRKEYTNNTYSPERQRCFRLAAGLQHDCVTKARNEATAYNREQQDLVAQRVTALWTKLMGGAAIVGMVLSAFGVFLVWTTFNATRQSNVIAREIGEAQVRAYLASTGGSIKVGIEVVTATIQIKNNGQSPARKTTASCTLVVSDYIGLDEKGIPVVDFKKTGPERVHIGDISSGSTDDATFYFFKESFDDETFKKLKDGHSVTVEIILNWFDVFKESDTAYIFLSGGIIGQFMDYPPLTNRGFDLKVGRHVKP
jgi:hypothetical protein